MKIVKYLEYKTLLHEYMQKHYKDKAVLIVYLCTIPWPDEEPIDTAKRIRKVYRELGINIIKNAPKRLKKHIENCEKEHELSPNLILFEKDYLLLEIPKEEEDKINTSLCRHLLKQECFIEMKMSDGQYEDNT